MVSAIYLNKILTIFLSFFFLEISLVLYIFQKYFEKQLFSSKIKKNKKKPINLHKIIAP